MIEWKYEHPLEYYTVDNFIKESREMIGKPVHGITDLPRWELASSMFISNYAATIGDNNPLYRDILYGVNRTKYGTLIAPPTFLITFGYPMCRGALFNGPYPLVGFEAAFEWEWNDVIRMNDKFTTEHVLKDVHETPNNKGRTVYLVSECKYFNKLSKEMAGTCKGTYAAIARAESITEIPEASKQGFINQPVTDRETYWWSDEDVDRLFEDVKNMVIRGNNPLYWEDVNIGDELPQIVKGPLATDSLMNWYQNIFSAETFPTFANAFRKWTKAGYPGFLCTNPITGWPYDIKIAGHSDPNMSGASGMPNTFGMGSLKVGLCEHLLTSWMSDDGFLRRLKLDTIEPYIYGDALWINGEVVDKYKEKLGGVQYRAVDIEIEAKNQLGQNVAPGTATVYLPSIDRVVELPIPQ